MSKIQKTIEIVVEGDMNFSPFTANGSQVSVVLTGAVVSGYSAQMGGPSVGIRPSQRGTSDHVKLKLSVDSADIQIVDPASTNIAPSGSEQVSPEEQDQVPEEQAAIDPVSI